MKRCPICAEEIQDEAIKCRFCGSDLTKTSTEEAGSDRGATPNERPLGIAQMGERYGLGTGADFYGIWDAQTPGKPLHRFPLTDAGWGEASARFRTLEPTAAPTSMGAMPNPSGTGYGPGPGTIAGGWGPTATGGSNGPAVASLVLGIVGVVFAFFPILGLILGILAVVFGYLGLKRAAASGYGRGFAIAGLVLGIIATVLGLLFVVVLREVVDKVGDLQGQLEDLQ